MAIFTSSILTRGVEPPVQPAPIHNRIPTFNQFQFGVYIASVHEVLDVPLNKVFRYFAERGITIIKINTHNYFPLAENARLNTYAKAIGAKLYVQMFYNPQWGDDEAAMRRAIVSQVKRVDALRDSDAVVAWNVIDEVESWLHQLPPEQRQTSINGLRRFIELVRQIDPKRSTAVNHDMPPWTPCGEDVIFASTGFFNIYSNRVVASRIEEAHRLGYPNYITVSQAAPIPPGRNNLRYYGVPDTVPERAVYELPQDLEIQQQAQIAFLEGASGIVYFLYSAGGDNYQPYTLVDKNGDDHLGKWTAVLTAAQNIRRWEGAPSTEITSPSNGAWLSSSAANHFTVSTQSPDPKSPVTQVTLEYSLDGGCEWIPMTVQKTGDGRYESKDPLPTLQKPMTLLLRARSKNSMALSLWKYVDVRLQP